MLIDRDKLLRSAKSERETCGKDYDFYGLLSDIEHAPTVDAVPLDMLCEWLARNAYAFECEDCKEYCRALLDCENEVGNDPKYWENKLTKWMEEQNEG